MTLTTHANPSPSLFWNSRLAAIGALSMAAWPVLRWYGARLSDGSDEPWGLIALAAAVFFAPRAGWREPLSFAKYTGIGAGLFLYAIFYPLLPSMIKAVALVSAIGAIATPPDFPFAWWTLLTLSLPWTATLQFYFGYPLRWATAGFDVGLLRLAGIAATHEATTVFWAGERVVVDAPCSGLQMLWAGWLLSALFACIYRLNTRASFRFFFVATTLILLANGLRTTALFCFETGLWPTFRGYHEGVGLTLFAGCAVLLFSLAERAAGQQMAAGCWIQVPAAALQGKNQTRP